MLTKTRRSAKTQVEIPQPIAARSIVVWGPTGSPGKSTLALNLADELANLKLRVLLVDSDLVAPSMALLLGALDQATGLSNVCRLARSAELDQISLSDNLVKISAAGSKFALLPGISGVTRWPEVTPTSLDILLQVAAEDFDVVIFDSASSIEPALHTDAAAIHRNEITRFLLANCEQAVLVARGTPLGLQRMIRQFLDVQHLRGHHETKLVVNALEPQAFAAQPEKQINELFELMVKRRPDLLIPSDPSCLALSSRFALPVRMVKRRSNFSRQIQTLAKSLLH